MFRLGISLLMVSFLMLSASPVCFADNPYAEKLATGLINLTTGWMEIGKQPMDTYNESNNIAEAWTVGLLKGVIFAVGRTIAGAIDTVFFFVAPHEKPLVEPMFDVFK